MRLACKPRRPQSRVRVAVEDDLGVPWASRARRPARKLHHNVVASEEGRARRTQRVLKPVRARLARCSAVGARAVETPWRREVVARIEVEEVILVRHLPVCCRAHQRRQVVLCPVARRSARHCVPRVGSTHRATAGKLSLPLKRVDAEEVLPSEDWHAHSRPRAAHKGDERFAHVLPVAARCRVAWAVAVPHRHSELVLLPVAP
mmetsp:Transcript_29399/g.88044  ORF Transcript_29399/g.88044 Transcript_29399/m.88044 type:complete len:204 (-) Transcript_29399:549-1160(-)